MNKLKSIKSEITITSPKGSLIAEINNLRKQLKNIKQSKKDITDQSIITIKSSNDKFIKSNKKSKSKQKQKNNQKDKYHNSITKQDNVTSIIRDQSFNLSQNLTKSHNHNSTLNNFNEKKDNTSYHNLLERTIDFDKKQSSLSSLTLNEIHFKQKDKKLKMDIELNKLRKLINKQDPQPITNQLNYIITLINTVNKQLVNKIQILQKNQKNQEDQLLIKRQQQQIDSLTKQVNQLEEIIRELKRQVIINKHDDDEISELNNLSIFQKNEIRQHNEQLESVLRQYEQQNIQLQEQNKILQEKLLKREQQILLLDEDINYLRIETENYKLQKKEINQLYESTCLEFRNFKRNKQIEVEKMGEEKDKWEKECKLRRNQSESIQSLQEHKMSLMKQLNEMRHLLTLKSTELDQKKSIMHENQKKVITLQADLYKLKADYQTVRNQKQFCEFQIEKLREEIQDLKKYLSKDSHNRQRFNSREKEKQKSLKQKPEPIQTNQLESNNRKGDQKQNIQQQQFYQSNHEFKKDHFAKQTKQKEQKLRALEDIHSMIKRHKQEMQL